VIAGSLAKRYARALLELAGDAAQIDRFEADLAGFAAACATPDADGTPLVATLDAGRHPASQRQAVARAVAQRLGCDPLVIRFLDLLVVRGRISGIDAIARHYRDLADERAGRVRGTVTSAQPLDPAELARITAALERATGRKVVLEVAVDAELIGGVVTRIGSYTLDRSVVSQLQSFRSALDAT
jgi:F-type H+-transporting ATPase subunit delta